MPSENHTAGLGLIPAAIVAVGPSEQPVERLIGLQSAIARAAGWLLGLRLPRIRFTPPLQPAKQGDRR